MKNSEIKYYDLIFQINNFWNYNNIKLNKKFLEKKVHNNYPTIIIKDDNEFEIKQEKKNVKAYEFKDINNQKVNILFFVMDYI